MSTPLTCGSSRPCTRLPLKAGAWLFLSPWSSKPASSTEICLLLQHYGADHTLRNCDGKTPLDVAKNQPTALVIRREATGLQILNAVRTGDFAKVQLLMTHDKGKELASFKGAITGLNPLHVLAEDEDSAGEEWCHD